MALELAIQSIKEEEFKFSDYNLKSIDSNELFLGIGLGFNLNLKKNLFTVRFTVSYNYKIDGNNVELMKFTNSTSFKVKGLGKIVKFVKEDESKFEFPDPLMTTFVGTAVSTARGMLVYKLSGTILSDFYLPLLDIKKILDSHDGLNEVEASGN